jgi:hypothetical protein
LLRTDDLPEHSPIDETDLATLCEVVRLLREDSARDDNTPICTPCRDNPI